MAKRMHDREIWQKEWFTKLSPDYKTFFFFLKDMCDNVGVWTPNFILAAAIIGKELDWNFILENCNGNIVVLDNGKWWLVDFCDFQHGELKEDSKNKAILSYIKLLHLHGLWDTYINKYKKTEGIEGAYRGTTSNPKEQVKEQEEVRVKEEEREVKKDENKKIAEKVIDYLNEKAEKRFSKCESNLKNISGRIKDGRTEKECYVVIDNKVMDWKDKPDWDQYLNPETLFRPSHFEKYLNQKTIAPPGVEIIPETEAERFERERKERIENARIKAGENGK
jgi:uncharacterized phage protein (TIGR02220 family)